VSAAAAESWMVPVHVKAGSKASAVPVAAAEEAETVAGGRARQSGAGEERAATVGLVPGFLYALLERKV